jgi:hypothetical protein
LTDMLLLAASPAMEKKAKQKAKKKSLIFLQ